MNINKVLLEKIDNNTWAEYNCDVSTIKSFLIDNTTREGRQNKATKIIKSILELHGKSEIVSYLKELATIEYGIRYLDTWIRDHVVHAMLTFILGVYLNEFYMPLNGAQKVLEFPWKLAGLLHDIAYPAQIGLDIFIQGFLDSLNKKLDSDSKINVKINFPGMEELNNDESSLILIQKQLEEWGLKINAKNEYTSMIESGKICHGIISGLSVLKVIDRMYQMKNPSRKLEIQSDSDNINWGQEYFLREVVPACTAIYIHNLDSNKFLGTKINPQKAPLAFLLKLSDVLQEWERPSKHSDQGLNANKFHIGVKDGLLVFKAPSDSIKRIKSDLSATLDVSNIDYVPI